MNANLFMKGILLFLMTVLNIPVSAQKVYGTVFSETGELLPYATVTIKGTGIGSSANDKARFSISLSPGNFTVICQHVGYTRQEKKITIDGIDEEITFILTRQKLDLKEVVVRSGAEDPAYAIIRKAIKKRPYYNKQVKGFECDLYTKDIIKLRQLPDRIFGKKIPDQDRKEMGVDSTGRGIIYLSESVARLHAELPGKFKMEVKSSRVSGSDGFGFTFPTFISLYENNVTVFSEKLNPRGFISPISDGAIGFYKYKFLGSFWEDGKEISSIRVMPRRKFEPLFSGVINIMENDWRIHSIDLTLTRENQLEILDTLQITQVYVPVEGDIWRVRNQLLHFNFNQFRIDAIGNFVNVYSGYSINPFFARNLFNRVIIKFDTAVNKRPKAYWDSIRPVPLEPEEKRDYIVKDSIYQLQKDSLLSQASVDSMNKRQGRIKALDLFWKGIHRSHYTRTDTYSWRVESLIKNLEYNPAEGVVINVNAGYDHYIKKWRSNFSVQPNFRYGVNNTHFNAWADLIFRTRDWSTDRKLKRQSWTISGGKRVTQFNRDNPIKPFDNNIGVLFFGDNFLKTYENYFGDIGFSKRFESGLRLSINTLYEDRIPLDNTTDFTFFKGNRSHILPNYPVERLTAQFTPHRAFITSFDISFKPGQRYIELPNQKIPIGSKYPTLSLNYTKGINGVLGSSVDFDKWRFTVTDDMNFKLGGLLKYKIGVGGFPNTTKVYIQDYQHFTGNRSNGASEYVNSFQMAYFYANSTIAPFFSFGFLEHHFNGLLTNKIPLLKRLNWNLVAGANVFYVNRNTSYVEYFAGLENIFKIFRFDMVTSSINGKGGFTDFRIGLDGIIGGNILSNSRGRSGSRAF